MPRKRAQRSSDVDAREAALAMLARRAQPAAVLRAKLLRKFEAEEVDIVLARFVELRLVDDAAYAESFVRDRFLRAGYGRERIRRDLQRKGVGAADIERAIEALVDDRSERELAERALARFCARRSAAKAESQTDSQAKSEVARKLQDSAFRHLIGRGFGVPLVRELVRDLQTIS